MSFKPQRGNTEKLTTTETSLLSSVCTTCTIRWDRMRGSRGVLAKLGVVGKLSMLISNTDTNFSEQMNEPERKRGRVATRNELRAAGENECQVEIKSRDDGCTLISRQTSRRKRSDNFRRGCERFPSSYHFVLVCFPLLTTTVSHA